MDILKTVLKNSPLPRFIKVYASTEDGLIGDANGLLWKNSADLKLFKALTLNNIVVMGGATFRSIGGKPLPNRINIVLSSTKTDIPSTHFTSNVDELLNLVRNISSTNEEKPPIFFIIGGAQMFNIFDQHYPETPTMWTKIHTTHHNFTSDSKIFLNNTPETSGKYKNIINVTQPISDIMGWECFDSTVNNKVFPEFKWSVHWCTNTNLF